jgi:hypothetical protein
MGEREVIKRGDKERDKGKGGKVNFQHPTPTANTPTTRRRGNKRRT